MQKYYEKGKYSKMKYKRILTVLIICILILTIALIYYAFFSKDNGNIIDNKENKTYQNNVTAHNTNVQNENNESNIISGENIVEVTNNEPVNEQEIRKDTQENQYIEEQNSENEIQGYEAEELALTLVKNEWGEDDSVYYTIDRNVGNKYDISVRSKANTQSLMEYVVDIDKRIVEIK